MEIIEMIFSNLINFLDMYSLKLVCKDYNLCIHKFSLIKMKLCKKIITENKKKLTKCVNINCCKDQKEIFLHISQFRYHPTINIINHQPAMNYDTIYINNNIYKIFSPYCCECLKENILIREIPKNKVVEHYCEGFVDIDYL